MRRARDRRCGTALRNEFFVPPRQTAPMRLAWTILACLASGLGPALAQGSVITRCGASIGHGYAIAGRPGVINSGWQRESISNGEITLTRRRGVWSIDLMETAGARTVGGPDGGLVGPMPGLVAGGFSFVRTDPTTGTIEHFLFSIDNQGRGEALWGAVRPGAGRGTLMQARCSGP